MSINLRSNVYPTRVAVAGSYETDTGQKTSTLIEQIENISDIEIISYYCHDINEAKKVLQKANLVEKFNHISQGKKLNKNNKSRVYTDNLEQFYRSDDFETIIVTELNTSKAVEIIFKSLLKGKNIINLNAASEVTLGLIFKNLATSRAIYSVGAGDEPAATLDLIIFCEKLGLKIIAAGKGKNNPLNIYCNPDCFEKKSQEIGVSSKSITSFVDGTKTMIEMAILSNASGFKIDKVGMHGPKADIDDITKIFCSKKEGGILSQIPVIDYTVGNLAPGVFVVFTSDQESIIEELNYLKMGSGPNYVLYKPYHLGNIESLLSIYDLVLKQNPTLVIKNSFLTAVAGRAKKNLKKGEILDSIGGYTFSGLAIDFNQLIKNDYVPIGILEDCRAISDIRKDEIISFDKIKIPEGNIVYNLWELQKILLEKQQKE